MEHAFGLLKGRFRRILHFTEHRQLGFVVNLITCACILHNICIDQNDDFTEIDMDDESEDEDESDGEDYDERDVTQDRRQDLFDHMMNMIML